MSWSSIASKAPIAAPAKQPPKAPVKQDKPLVAPAEAVPAKKANTAPPTAAAPAKIAAGAPPSASKVSSWASKVGSSVKPAPPKAAPKKSAPSQAPAKTSAAPSPVVVSNIPTPITITKTEGWGQLPADILSHHLAPTVEHASTIRVLRRLNRHYAKSISLPRVKMDPPRDGDAPFLGALSVCDSAEVSLAVEHAAFVMGALEHLKKNQRLKELRLRLFGPFEADMLKNIGFLLESAPLLETLGLVVYDISDPQLAIFTGALQRSNSRIKNVSVVFQSNEILSKNTAAFIACLASIGVEKFTPNMLRLQPEVAKALATWLSSPSCSLIEFTSVDQMSGDVASIVFDGYKLNRSLRRLTEPYVSASSASRFVDAIVQQGKIEHLTFSVESEARNEALFDLVTKNERVKCDGSVLPYNVTYADEKTICDYIKSDKCVSHFNHIRSSLWKYRNSPQLAEALKANRTMKKMTISAGEYQEDQFYFSLIAGNPNLHTLTISYFQRCPADLKAALSKNKGLKKVKLEKDFLMDIAPAEMKNVVSAIGQVRSLEKLIFYRGSLDDSCVSELSTLIKRCKNLRCLELGKCIMSEASLIQILTAIASSGGLEDLNMREVELHSLSSSRDTFNKALLRVLETNPLQQLSMDRWELDPSTINCIVTALDKMETLTLRIWDLGKVNMPAVVRKNVDGLVNRKAGLLKVYFQ